MINKIYAKLKNIIKENFVFIIITIFLFLITTIKLPYYIDMPGGLIDVSDRISITDGYTINGSYNLTYVSEKDATIPAYIIAKFNKNWDIVKIEDEILSNETIYDDRQRGKLMLEESKQNSIMIALDKANIDYEINDQKVFVISVDPKSDTDLKVGDQLVEINNKKINSKKDLFDITSKNNSFDIKVVNNNKEYKRYANKKDFGGVDLIGIMVAETKNIVSNKNVIVDFKKSESGPSGGLMLTLSLYDSLTKEDLAKGRKIAGTGTINELGYVGPIGGVKYKIKGAVKEKASIFFVPTENYDEALQTIKENNLDIDLVEVKHINDAIKYLNN